MAFVAPNRDAGRILYQGEMDRARGIAGAVNQFIDEGYRRQQEEKDFSTKLKVTEAAINTFIKPKAAEFGLTPADVEAFMKRSNDESTKQYANRLGGFLETTITTGKMNREMEQAKTQREYTDALRQQALAAKAASDAATDDRRRQQRALTGLETSLAKFTDYERRAVAGSRQPLNRQEADEYEDMKNNPILQSAMLGMRAGAPDMVTAVQLGQEQQRINNRREVDEAVAANREALAEIKKLQAEVAAAKAGQPGTTAKVGDTKQAQVGNKKITVEWNGKTWVEMESGIPHLSETRDAFGNVTGSSVNPELMKFLGVKDVVPGSRPGSKEAAPMINIDAAEAYTPAPPAVPASELPPLTFDSDEEFNSAVESGAVQPGRRVIVAGVRGVAK